MLSDQPHAVSYDENYKAMCGILDIQIWDINNKVICVVFRFLSFRYMGVLPHVCLCTTYVQCLKRPGEGVGSLRK